ncbi:hypothetical protein RVW00_000770 [Enterobacter bugandensis]|nr:hypothetical protein [Enterobacter bugandensis]
MTPQEIWEMREAARLALLDAMKAQSLSFGGVNNRSITHQKIADLKREFRDWDRQYREATGKNKSKSFSLVRFGRI